MKPWQRFINLLKLDKRDIRQIFYYAVFAGLVALTLPLGIQAIINLIQGAEVSTSWIVLVVLVTLGVAFQGILQLMQIRILENIQQKIFTRSSFEFAYRFPKIKWNELRQDYPPELANRFFDTLTVQKGLSKILLDFPAAILQILFGLILLSLYHPFFIIYGLLLLILVYVVFNFTAKKGLETSLKESKSKYAVAHWLQEIARSLTSFKLSGRTSLAMEHNNRLTENYLETRENHFKILMTQFIQMIGFKVLVTAGLLLIGGLLVLNLHSFTCPDQGHSEALLRFVQPLSTFLCTLELLLNSPSTERYASALLCLRALHYIPCIHQSSRPCRCLVS